jgi:hypothetical protein
MDSVSTQAKSGQQLQIGVRASDPEGGKLTVSCSGGTDFADHGNGTGTFYWVAETVREPKTFVFPCSAIDDAGLSADATIAVTVNP